jgi:beta-glucanase (GH16 family)
MAKLPKGKGIWPAIWMLPTDETYGTWPRSGEIDIMESRGDPPQDCKAGFGLDSFGSTMHWGAAWDNTYNNPGGQYTQPDSTTLGDDYHLYELEWTATEAITKIDGTTVMTYKLPPGSGYPDMFSAANGAITGDDNPWASASDKNAPFDQEFHLILNIAVGGAFFLGDGACGNNWTVNDPKSFWERKNEWYPTWNYPQTDDSAMKIDFIKVYSHDDETPVYHIDPTEKE